MARAASTVEAGDSAERILQILSESARLFATNGYDGTSMRDIAEACGISKSLLYHHFTDKDEIFARIALGSTRELYQFVFDRLPEGATPTERLRAFMVATGEYFQRYRWAWLASTSAFWSDPEQRRQKERMMWRDRYEGLVRTLIQQAIDAGEFRPLDVPLAGRLVLSALNWMHRWYKPDKGMPAPQIADAYFDMIFRGLRAE
ncbi:TetR/AcrR family transcriptional regulator [Falsiroseomonas stagni]|uniref:Transcriptional regulator, TetR family n=1 Tax=Falsiroseomonas stagni DSM 19981 TaxID=1123062 RepID=A0A1I3XS21_9PROT|nr:TetR/AcrR family transcriptional regulator [Falsiroseomonas stagni]MBX9595789.1 TetR/AcrR family transcriptional regulator [Roseomonas sp.]MBX9700363.1 TetR/AcrR family transcriptional regulator [Acetobacteraceae bacterium]SFK22328.1 transcriptional regulator, TetR family [Falsiroseomonas stagni DSM 19981]